MGMQSVINKSLGVLLGVQLANALRLSASCEEELLLGMDYSPSAKLIVSVPDTWVTDRS